MGIGGAYTEEWNQTWISITHTQLEHNRLVPLALCKSAVPSGEQCRGGRLRRWRLGALGGWGQLWAGEASLYGAVALCWGVSSLPLLGSTSEKKNMLRDCGKNHTMLLFIHVRNMFLFKSCNFLTSRMWLSLCKAVSVLALALTLGHFLRISVSESHLTATGLVNLICRFCRQFPHI